MCALMSVTPLCLISVTKATCKLDMAEETFNVKLLHYSSKGENVNYMMDALMQFKPALKKAVVKMEPHYASWVQQNAQGAATELKKLLKAGRSACAL